MKAFMVNGAVGVLVFGLLVHYVGLGSVPAGPFVPPTLPLWVGPLALYGLVICFNLLVTMAPLLILILLVVMFTRRRRNA